ncbi:MAG: methyltransferase domain-containing protein, partial [Nitrosopumilus sp. B06]
SSTRIPLSDGAADRVLALESAQHFKPFRQFISESKRVLASSGLLVLAIPVVTDLSSDLGILKFTWSSEHYSIGYVRDMIRSGGFEIIQEEMIGDFVYVPLADYYARERERLKGQILEQYPSYVESVLFRSIKRMKKASKDNAIDYVLFKCRLS